MAGVFGVQALLLWETAFLAFWEVLAKLFYWPGTFGQTNVPTAVQVWPCQCV